MDELPEKMNELRVFENEDFGAIRKVLGYGKGNLKNKSLNNAVNDHVEEDDKGVTVLDTTGGMYDLILGSELVVNLKNSDVHLTDIRKLNSSKVG